MPTDLDAYFARIGYTGPRDATLATLNGIVAAHAQTIPFENLDVLLGRPISLDPDAVFKKLIHDRRGGYCFEQNGLLLRVFEALGFRATSLSGRVRWQRPRDVTPARTHLFIRAEINGVSWLADVGVGGPSLTSAIRLVEDLPQTTPHDTRRLIREGARLFHQVRFATGGWSDVCEFTLEDMPQIDRELANWFTSAHPQSHFKNRLIAARAAPAGVRLTLMNHEFTTRAPDGTATVHPITSPEALLAILAEHFGLRFPTGTRFGPPGSPWPS
ncbi:MAG: arylamine N-acetyltransferase [Undibacterium sp.]|nr:arylamine N-acetyltransferase [Opitutaceae bacterium]